MHRQLPVLVARAVVASSTSQADAAENALKDKKQSWELSEAATHGKACEVNVTIKIKIEEGKVETKGTKEKSEENKRRNNESSSGSNEKKKKTQK
jgi:hypothetical protein